MTTPHVVRTPIYDPRPFVRRRRYRAYSYAWWQRCLYVALMLIAVAAVSYTAMWVVVN